MMMDSNGPGYCRQVGSILRLPDSQTGVLLALNGPRKVYYDQGPLDSSGENSDLYYLFTAEKPKV